MTLQEFKAWFDGFTENVPKQPTLKQWARIKERVGEIDGAAITERIYVDRWYPYRQWYPHTWPYYSPTAGMTNATGFLQSAGSSNTVSVRNCTFDGINAMHAAGQAEAASLN